MCLAACLQFAPSGMPSGGTQYFWYGSARRTLAVQDPRGPRRASVGPALEHQWLEELRLRFDLAIEVLDPDLEYVLGDVPDVHGVALLRAALQRRNDPALRDTAAIVARSGKARSFTMGGLRIRMFPLFARMATPPITAGVLVIADTHMLQPDAGADVTEEIDRRLDTTGQWLTAAIEAAIGATTLNADEARSAQRLVAVIEVIKTLGRLQSDREIVALTMEAIALWYDADVRVYRQDVSGEFLLDACLPGVSREAAAQRLVGHQIWGRNEVFALESVRELEELGWDGSAIDTLFMPLSIDESTEWLVTVAGATDPSAKTTLGFVGHTVGALLTTLEWDAAERLRRKLGAILTFGDAPFAATAQVALEAVARDTGATSAQLTIYYEGDAGSVLTVQWGTASGDAPFVEAATTTIASDSIGLGTAAGSGVTAVLQLRVDPGAFAPAAVRLARSAATILGVWIAGALIRPNEVRVPSESEYSAEFVARLRGQVDGMGRLKVGGAVAVVLPDMYKPSGSQLDDVMQIVQDRVRSSDVVAVVEAAGAGVLLPEASRDVATAIVGRLLDAARNVGMTEARVGIATFPPASESPATLLRRALMNARRGTALS